VNTLRTRLVLLFPLLAVLALPACGGDDGSGPGGQRNAPSSIVVLADSSLKQAFTRMGNQFESQNPGNTVTFTYGTSTALAQQAVAGDPGDVLSTNSRDAMNSAQKVQLGQLETFASKGPATYQIVTLTQSRNTTLAQRFIDLVTSPTGQKILKLAGFGPP
jgi:ABC-type molybdate transport system substrate-binding protein